ncbi:MAG: alkaline phosphatase family protein, partial [Deltaproteobacteria bacterium]
RQEVPFAAEGGEPLPNCTVVVFYIDGLRPDVVEEMAAMGHIPHLRKYFVDGGTHLTNAFTAFPSDTITSNGTMWTGCFSDRHGLKGQVRFSRTRLRSESFLETLGPARSQRHLGPHGLDKVVHDTQAATVGLVKGADGERDWRDGQTSATPAIYDYLRARKQDWATGILPIMTEMPPPLWTRSMTRVLPYLQSQQAWRYVDDANADFAIRHLIRQYRPVTVIWLPETDSVSHKECRGQFGSTRRTIARADRLVGEVVSELEAQNRLESTYLILVSDHGHLGGQKTHLSRFDLADEFFFNPRQMTRDGRWVGGGLGLSVRQHRLANWHQGDKADQFVFIDGDSDGTARIFLPRGSYRSRNWDGANSAGELLAYRLDDHLPPINLPETLARATATHDDGSLRTPIDLVLMKLDDESILITTCDRGQAVIQRRLNDIGRWEYRYTPVEGVSVTDIGKVVCREAAHPQADPLGLLKRVRSSFLKEFHDERTWLWVTATSDYPDGVVTLTRHMLWQDAIKVQEKEYAPDLVVTARHGWLFATQNTPGTTHGYPLAESVRATWYVSGPNVRRGARAEAPCRLADLTPTILELTGTEYDRDKVDGRALRNIFETDPEEIRSREIGPVLRASARGVDVAVRERAMFWEDFDLRAWQPLDYTPSAEYEHTPLSMNHPGSGWDINNIAYNALSIGDWSVFRLIDDVLSPVNPGSRTKKKRPVDPVEADEPHTAESRRRRNNNGVEGLKVPGISVAVDAVDQRAAHSKRPWVGDGVRALNVPQVTLSDYSLTSVGNMKRVDSVVDWLQDRGTRLDDKLSVRTRHRTVLGAPATNSVIDAVQGGFWEVYRFGSRIGVQLIDEMLLNGIENGVDSTINAFRATPAEVIVE